MRSNGRRGTATSDSLAFRREQLRQLFAKLHFATAISLINGLIVSAVQWSLVPRWQVLTWLGALATVGLFRTLLWIRFQTADLEAMATVRRYVTLFRVNVLLSGSIWSAMAFLMFPTHAISNQVFLAFVAGGMASASVTTLAPDRWSVQPFLTLCIVPLGIRFFAAGGTLHIPMGAMVFLFWLGLHLSAQVSTKTFRTLYELRAKEKTLAAQRRSLAQRLLDTQEEERRRIARELHDDLGQSLTGIKLLSSSILHKAQDKEHVHTAATQLKALSDTTLDSVRSLARGLRPAILDDLGLEPALESLANSHRPFFSCQAAVLSPTEGMSTDLSTAIYRIVQEALTNVVRHANATQVWIRLQKKTATSDHRSSLTAPHWLVEIEDDGAGIEAQRVAPANTLGILGMTERAALLDGELRITRSPEGGTRVQAEIPGD